MDGGDVVVPEPQAGHGPGSRVLRDHVEAGGELEHQVAALRGLEVHAHAALAEVVAEERGAHLAPRRVGHRRQRAAAEVTPLGVLDLDHLRPEAGQELGGVGQRLHLLQGEHPDAVERLARPGRGRVGDVSEAHPGDGSAGM
jgi:hypothetical protein